MSTGGGQDQDIPSLFHQEPLRKRILIALNIDNVVQHLLRFVVEQFFDSKKLDIPSLFHQEPLRKRILIALNIDIVVQHLLRFVVEQNQERI